MEWNQTSSIKTEYDMNNDIVSRLKCFMENEARSCSMDFGGVTPLYVYRMWGGQVPLKDSGVSVSR